MRKLFITIILAGPMLLATVVPAFAFGGGFAETVDCPISGTLTVGGGGDDSGTGGGGAAADNCDGITFDHSSGTP